MRWLARLVRRPVAAALASVAVMLAGVMSFISMPIAELPSVDLPTLVVNASLPGASPETMATSIAMPLEKRLGQIAGIAELTSLNIEGASQITIQFGGERDVAGAFSDVLSAVNAASSSLPRDMPAPPSISKVNPSLIPIVFLAASSRTIPAGRVYEHVDRVIAQPLAQIDGVSRVVIQGGQRSAVRIRTNPAALAALGIGADDVSASVIAANALGPKGELQSSSRTTSIAVDDQLLQADSYGPLVIARRNGSVVRLDQIAAASESVADERLAGWYNNEPSIFLLVQREAGANIVATAQRVSAALPRLRQWLPPGIELLVAHDRTFKIRETIAESYWTMLLTTLCVIGIILLSLQNLRASLIPCLAIPISLLGTIIVMRMCGYSINTISLLALTVAVGFVVDDAIVMLENVSRYLEEGYSQLEATLRGAQEITFTIASITMSLIAALLPLVLVPGVLGKFLREFSVTLSAAIIISAVVSVTLIPVMCANILPGRKSLQRSSQFARFRQHAAKLDSIGSASVIVYERFLSRSIRHPSAVLIVLFAIAAATGALLGHVRKGFLPAQDAGVIAGFTEAAQDVSFAAMSAHQREVARIILEDPAVEGVLSYIGAVNGTSAGTGRMFVTLKPRAERQVMWVVLARLNRRLADVPGISTFLRSADDVNVGAREGWGRYQFTLQADDPATLEQAHAALLHRLKNAPEFSVVASDQRSGGLQARLSIDRDKAALLNITPLAIDEALYSAFGQRQIATVYSGFTQHQIILEADGLSRDDALDRVHVRSASGEMVPLRAVTSQTIGSAATAVSHHGQFPSITISFDPLPGVALSDAMKIIESEVKSASFAPGVRASFEGNARAFSSSSGSGPWLLLGAIVAIYVVLGILYESYLHPVTILSTLPTAGLGGVIAVMVCGIEFTVLSFVGLVLVLGLVMKNAIMMIDFALNAQRTRGLSALQAIQLACTRRFRPIMMTTATALVGALPLVFDTGAGAEMRQSFGVVVIGGLLVAQILTLFTTPVVFLMLDSSAMRAAEAMGLLRAQAPPVIQRLLTRRTQAKA